MNIFSGVVLLLQSALSLLGVVQQNPNLPPATQTQAVQTAQQAIQTATTQLSQSASQSVGTTATAQASTPTDCSKYTWLKVGDTDAQTNGLVSQLQRLVGGPITGTYGARTNLAYHNVCIGGNSQPTSVAGMSKYTDSTFGFSFWYPSSWTVQKSYVTKNDLASTYDMSIGEGDWSSSVPVLTISNGTQAIYLAEETSVSGISTVGSRCSDTFYFDDSTGWMHGTCPAQSDLTTVHSTADTSVNTMGGLHIFSGEIVPLSATTFVVAGNGATGANDEPLVRTIVATDLSVAQPVPTAQQLSVIQAEAQALGANSEVTPAGSNSSGSREYMNNAVSLSYPSDFTLAQDITAAQKNDTISYMSQGCTGDPVCLYYTGQGIADVESAFFSVQSSADRTYEDCTVTESKTSSVTINGVTWYKDSTGDAGLGHRLTTDTYRTYYNGACFEAYLSIAWGVGQGNGPDQIAFDNLQQELTTIMDSVTFVMSNSQPVKHASNAPAWSTYAGSAVPVSFTYPGSFLVNEITDEVDVGPGSYVGLQKHQSVVDPGSIDVQMTPSKYFFGAANAQAAMQAKMNTEPIGYPSTAFTPLTLGGETAYSRGGTVGTQTTVLYVAHGNAYYRIILWGTLLPQEYSTFVNSFRFTN